MKLKQILFIFLLVFTFSFSSASSFGYNYLDNKITGSINNSYTTINNTYINQTVNATVNSTQFTSNNPITIDTSWLSSFLNGIYCKLTGCNMSGSILNISSYGLNTGYTSTGSEAIGTTYWDSVYGTTSTKLSNDMILQNGEETFFYTKASGNILNGQVCEFVTAQGSHILGKVGNSTEIKTDPFRFMGIATETFTNGNFGRCTWFGRINSVYTHHWNGTTFIEWADGDALYWDNNNGSQLTNVKPQAPNITITVGYVIKAETPSHQQDGAIQIAPEYGHRMQDSDDIDGYPLNTTGQFYVWNETLKVFNANYNVNNFLTSSNLSNYVPYSGATSNVNLNGKNLTNVSYLQINGTLSIINNTGFNVITTTVSGNVGIGTTNPTKKLDVNGTISGSNYELSTANPTSISVTSTNSILPFMLGSWGDQFAFKPINKLEYKANDTWIDTNSSQLASVLFDNSQLTSLIINPSSYTGFRVTITAGTYIAPDFAIIEQGWTNSQGSCPLNITYEYSTNGISFTKAKNFNTSINPSSSVNHYAEVTGHVASPIWRITVDRLDNGTNNLHIFNIKLIASTQLTDGFLGLPFYWDYNRSISIKNSSGSVVNYLSTNGNSYFRGGNVGIGTTSPTAKLDVRGTEQDLMATYNYANTTQASTIYLRARGTQSNPLAVTGSDYLGYFSFRGYDGTQFSGTRALFGASASETWNNTARGTFMNFWTTSSGTDTIAERMRISDNGNVGIGKTTPSAKLDVNGSAVIGNTTGNISIDNQGNLILNGEATQWDDMTMPLANGKIAGLNVPSWDIFKNGTYAYSFIADSEIFATQQMSHSYKLNSTIYQHVHLTPSSTNTGNVTICIEYTKADINTAFPNTITSCGTAYINGTNYQHILVMDGNIGSFNGLSGIINARIYRNTTTIGSAYPDKVFILAYDLHYLRDSFGSNGELVK